MNIKTVTQIHHHTSDEDLIKSLTKTIKELFEVYSEKLKPSEQINWITRKQVSEILSISLVTVDDWSKRSILTAYRIGNKKRFKRKEVEKALTKINH
ncbi:helix-turn-helix domain-containing protein [Tenacibaculum aquimarinum]|uniref:helix-turn-helix domain-containing protein n=1 Tax=Tenacibaculum aquimarinum TaxID=2910675 RepID=UPI001F0A1809|nr:helix-turn-helix domain-containing protein [Tenacibaculum aquimarinum]MCH3881712.1 helix-turn-helix domain-containing protein [Tenacibaculum aquimarinum]